MHAWLPILLMMQYTHKKTTYARVYIILSHSMILNRDKC